jgi:hypothetical protein
MWLKTNTKKSIVNMTALNLKNSNAKNIAATKQLKTSLTQGKESTEDNNINVNKELLKIVEQGVYGNKVINNKELEYSQDKETSQILQLYDKKVFEDWKAITIVKQQLKKSNKQKQKVTEYNYYSVLEEDQTDAKVYQTVNMPEVEPDEFKAIVFETSTLTTATQETNSGKDNKAWTRIVSKEKAREFQAIHETTSHRYLPKHIMQPTDTEKKCNYGNKQSIATFNPDENETQLKSNN